MVSTSWESVTNPLDKLSADALVQVVCVGNQLPILLISFLVAGPPRAHCWESVTNPLDKLSKSVVIDLDLLGISYQSS